MRDTLPLLDAIPFPALRRGRLETLQINVGYRCNQSCFHCHVNAGPNRTEEMSGEVADTVLAFLERHRTPTLDITGGAPELNAHFRRLVTGARALGVHVMDRCNLTILEQPGQEDLADFLAGHEVEVVASMPCYLEGNVDNQRGKGVFDGSLRGLRKLNARGYGRDPALRLNLVYNPQGPSLPPPQASLEADYKRVLGEQYGIVFDQLYVLANMPIQRFGSMLVTKGEFDGYLQLLQDAHLDANLDGVMCRSLLSVDWRGYVYDCDFNQMLDLPLAHDATPTPASVRSARRRACRQSDPRRRPLLWLHRRPGLELRRRVERGGGMNILRARSPTLPRKRAREKQVPAASARATIPMRRVNSRARPISPPTRSMSSAASTAISPRWRPSNGWRRAKRRTPTLVFNGDFHWFDAEPDWFARDRARRGAALGAARQCGDRSRPQRRYRRRLRLRLSGERRCRRSAPLQHHPAPVAPACDAARPRAARRAADASGGAGGRPPHRHRARRRRRARRLALRP